MQNIINNLNLHRHIDHDYFPTNKLVLANLSLVLTSYRQDIAINSITIKNIATSNPDNIDGVILINNWLGLSNCDCDGCVCESNLAVWEIGLSVKNMIDYGFCLRILVNYSGVIC